MSKCKEQIISIKILKNKFEVKIQNYGDKIHQDNKYILLHMVNKANNHGRLII